MKYQITPIIVDAIQWTGTKEALEQIKALSMPYPNEVKYTSDYQNMMIVTTSGTTFVNHGDWIVKGAPDILFIIPNYVFPILFTSAEKGSV